MCVCEKFKFMASFHNMQETTRRKIKEHNDKTAPKTWRNMLKFPQIASLILLALGAVALHWTYNNGNVVSLENLVLLGEDETVSKNGIIQDCNLFSGRWVYDDVSYPLYKEGNCSFMEDDFTCEKYGRKDLKYQKWRWQPHHCDLPRFNGAAFLEKIRGKKLVFVGDSLNRNQWRSMLCMIDSYLPPSSTKSLQVKGNLKYFHSMEYNATIGLYWAPFLVESNCDGISLHGGASRTIRINSIEKHGKHWLDADILVFDSFVWWMNPKLTILWGSFGSPDAIYKKVQMTLQPYEIALNTWSEWLEMHINRTKTKLFFMSFSPYRLGFTIWGTSATCNNKTEPIFNETYWPNAAKRNMMQIVESTIEKLEEKGLKVEYLNITQLSGYREDAHLSLYRPFWHSQNKEQFKDPMKYSDCLHWCLPGVPDIWNELLYAYIMKIDSF